MPADIKSNLLGAITSAKKIPPNSGNFNKNQLVSGLPSQNFDTQLSWEVAQSSKSRSQHAKVDRSDHHASYRTDSARPDKSTRESGNDFPRRVNERPRSQDNAVTKPQRREQQAGKTPERVAHHTDRLQNQQQTNDTSEKHPLKQPSDTKIIQENPQEQPAEEASPLQASVLTSAEFSELQTGEETVVAATATDSENYTDELITSEMLGDETLVSETIIVGTGEDVKNAVEPLESAVALSTKEHLQHLLNTDISLQTGKEDTSGVVAVEATEQTALQPQVVAASNEALRAALPLDTVLTDIELPATDMAELKIRLQSSGVLNSNGNIPSAQLENAQRVVSQLIKDRLVQSHQVSGEADQSGSDEAVAEGEGDAGITELLKINEKLKAKSSDVFSRMQLEGVKLNAKPGEILLQQKLETAIGQIRSSTGADNTSTVTSERSASTNMTAFSTAVTKAGEHSATQVNSAKSFSATMQTQFNRAGWAPEVAQRLMMMVTQKVQVAEIRLDPPDLGPMEVKVKMQQEHANVVFNTQHAAVKDALEQALPRLRELFAENGLSLGDVDVRDHAMEQRQEQEEDVENPGVLALDDEMEEIAAEAAVVTQSDQLVDYYA